jgi:hypothetical protein
LIFKCVNIWENKRFWTEWWQPLSDMLFKTWRIYRAACLPVSGGKSKTDRARGISLTSVFIKNCDRMIRPLCTPSRHSCDRPRLFPLGSTNHGTMQCARSIFVVYLSRSHKMPESINILQYLHHSFLPVHCTEWRKPYIKRLMKF